MIKVGTKVKVIAGKDKGKEGEVLKTMPSSNRVLIKGINIAKKHMKKDHNHEGHDHANGGIVEKEMAINASNVMVIDNKTKKAVRLEKS